VVEPDPAAVRDALLHADLIAVGRSPSCAARRTVRHPHVKLSTRACLNRLFMLLSCLKVTPKTNSSMASTNSVWTPP